MARNGQALWSGIPRDEAQRWADEQLSCSCSWVLRTVADVRHQPSRVAKETSFLSCTPTLFSKWLNKATFRRLPIEWILRRS
jgi:hypothetical protein